MDNKDKTDTDNKNFAAASFTEDKLDHSDVIDIINEEVSFYCNLTSVPNKLNTFQIANMLPLKTISVTHELCVSL